MFMTFLFMFSSWELKQWEEKKNERLRVKHWYNRCGRILWGGETFYNTQEGCAEMVITRSATV